MNKEEFLGLAKKYAENTATAEEQKAVDYFFDTLQENQDDVVHLQPSNEKGHYIFSSIKTKIGLPKQKSKAYKKILQIAAALFILSGLLYTTLLLIASPAMITQTAANGERKQLQLIDGSIVILNANSSITYPEKFETSRQVELTGEAYFKVYRDTLKPFIVNTHDVTVRVLGTSFNINSYNNLATKVSVVSGRVQVNSPSGRQIILTKNEQAAFAVNNNLVRTAHESSEQIAWIDNTIFLKNTTLAETAGIIKNWYGVTVEFEEPELAQLTISGKFKDEKLENVLQSIAFIKHLKIIYKSKNHVLIRRNVNAN